MIMVVSGTLMMSLHVCVCCCGVCVCVFVCSVLFSVRLCVCASLFVQFFVGVGVCVFISALMRACVCDDVASL